MTAPPAWRLPSAPAGARVAAPRLARRRVSSGFLVEGPGDARQDSFGDERVLGSKATERATDRRLHGAGAKAVDRAAERREREKGPGGERASRRRAERPPPRAWFGTGSSPMTFLRARRLWPVDPCA